MKKVRLFLGLILLAACQSHHSHQDNLDYLDTITDGAIDAELKWHDSPFGMTDREIDSVADILREMGMKMTPYKNVDSIEKEFKLIMDQWDMSYPNTSLWEDLLCARMKFHFSNPVTYYHMDSSSTNPITVAASPDGKYKFYTSWNLSQGTMSYCYTLYQYLDTNGKVVCKEWQEERRFDCLTNPVKVWQFDYHDTTFYVLKSFRRSSSRECGWDMEIATFDNGTPKYHIRFFPDMKEYGEIKRVNGDSEEWVKEGGAYSICYTWFYLDIDYTFDPKTLIVTARTQDDGKESLVTKRWRLKTEN